MPNKKATGTSVVNGDDYVRRLRKGVAKRQLERAVKRSEEPPASEEKPKREDELPSQKLK